MWNNYFFQIQKKYNMRISTKLPFVIRFDGRQVTKNTDINLLDRYNGSFFDSLERTACFFSERYHCFSIFGADEISFVVPRPYDVIEDLEPSDKTTHSHELLALFSQYFFDYFNHFDVHQKIFWHGKCCSIPAGKVSSYIKYRSGIIKNAMVTYFAKKNEINNPLLSLEDKIKLCKTRCEYDAFSEVQDGVLYFDGSRIKLDDFINTGVIDKFEIKADKDIPHINIDDIDIEIL